MPPTSKGRPPGIFSGAEQLRPLMEVVGRIVTNLGAVEDSLRYLHWQLQAFTLAESMVSGAMPDNDIQMVLAPQRTQYLGRHMVLYRILDGIDDAFAEPAVKTALAANEPAVAARWTTLKTKAKDLGNRRNERAHSAIAISGTSPVRQALLAPPRPFKPEDDEKLVSDITAFHRQLGELINELTQRLPFRDFNTVHFATMTVTV